MSNLTETIKPLLELLAGEGTFVTTIISWIAAISAVLAPFAVFIRNKLADALNRVAESSDQNDDTYLRRLFGNPIYRFGAFLLNFANIRFPILADLERAIRLQREAVVDAQSETPNLPNL